MSFAPLQVWILLVASLLLLVAILRVISCSANWDLNYNPGYIVLALFLMQDIADPSVTRSRRLSVRVFLVTLYFLGFMTLYTFTGRLTSYLHLPLLETVPDTNDKLLKALRTGSIEPCVARNSFVNVTLLTPRTEILTQIRDSVPDWGPYVVNSLYLCGNRTRDHRAVTFSSILNLEDLQYRLPGLVEIAKEYVDDNTPMSYMLPKASVYKEEMQDV
ncbi:unnamed protein product [Ixodes hexagonus]